MKRFLASTVLRALAHAPGVRKQTGSPRLLVIRRNRMGDMIMALPLIRALKTAHPGAWITVLCDPEGAPIARACPEISEVVLLRKGGNRWVSLWINRPSLTGYDMVFGVKAGFDFYLAALCRLSGAPVRVGFEEKTGASPFFTHPVALPPREEHQARSCLRLAGILGIEGDETRMGIAVPPAIAQNAALALGPLTDGGRRPLCVVSISTNQEDRWPAPAFVQIVRQLVGEAGRSVGISSAPADRALARSLVHQVGSPWAQALETPTTLELAGCLGRAEFVLCFEGGVVHLAAACGTPALVLWRTQAPVEKWGSLGRNHHYLRAGRVSEIPVAEVWAALQRFVRTKNA
ncbi:MAG: glycosyltransferase family 9 protein [Verrucomicrobiae bacterium]|nr:glycosyltransferase family 9 protein [Verrucomicrobiae bacterium]